MRVRGWLCLPFLFIPACQDVTGFKTRVDIMVFDSFGKTLFSRPEVLTTRDFHFDNGGYFGREVLIEGQVKEWGQYDTHLVVEDEFGRLLVVTTEIGKGEISVGDSESKAVRILGVVERGKKGLPFLLAKSIVELGAKSTE